MNWMVFILDQLKEGIQIITIFYNLQVRCSKHLMFLQQKIFSVYRLILKPPKFVFIAALVFMIYIAITQINYISKTNNTVDLSSALLQYMILKNQQRQAIKEQSLSNNTISNSSIISTDKANETAVNDFTFIDDTTLLHFTFEQIGHYNITLNYAYNSSKNQEPFMVLIKNQHLSYLNKFDEDYLQRHGITYDLISIPMLEIQGPMFTYFFKEDMQKNQIMMESMRISFFMLEAKFNIYRLMKNITDGEMQISQIFLNFYYQSGNEVNYLSTNFFQFLTFKILSPLFLKAVFGFSSFILIVAANIFTGLLIRYSIILVFTIYLAAYNQSVNNVGWMYSYLAMINTRLQNGRLETLKIMVFYLFSSIGMPLILAFGAYCVLAKLIMPSLPLLIDQYAVFFLVTVAIIQLFHYVFSRSRTTIKFFPILSFISSLVTLTICTIKNSPFSMMILNLNMTAQIIFFILFALIEKKILQENQKGFHGIYCPSISKPRMLFYAGYDISWQKSLPPLWTFFTSWFDYSHFNQHERCLLEGDYQLLYGRMLGFNERQEIPQQDDEEMREEQMQVVEQPSNEMNLILS